MKKPLISILISARNEEKVIGKALETIKGIIDNEYKNIEVLVGSDSTDNTNKIVKKYKFAKLIASKIRLGKNETLKRLYKIARGEIIIIHDADWYFVSNHNFNNLINYFKNPKVGGLEDIRIATTQRMPVLNLGESFLGQLLREFKIERYAIKDKDGNLYARKNVPFLFFVNIFRKSALTEEQYTMCDDGERGLQLMRNGYKIIIPSNIPYFATNYTSKITIKDLYREKMRGYFGKKQIQERYNEFNAGFFNFYIPAFIYCLKRISAVFIGMVLYWFVCFWVMILNTGKKVTTKDGWKLRLKR